MSKDTASRKQAALKTLYLVTRSLHPKGRAGTMVTRWKPALNGFAVTFRRPNAGRGEPLMKTVSYTVDLTDPVEARGGTLGTAHSAA